MTSIGAIGQLDRRIIAALQLNGRASWKQVATAVGATESTVARRGQQLLDSGVVVVTGVLDHLRCGLGISLQVRLRCRPGTANVVAEALAALDVTRFVAVVTGSADVAAEFVVPHHRDVAAVLAADGRASYAQIAAAVGVSDSTAARRVESLIRRGCLRFRTVFDAALIGLDVEFLQWLTVEPGELENVGAQLAKQGSTRYVSATTGRFNLCLYGVLPGYGDLYHYMTAVVGALPGVRAARRPASP